MTCHAQTGRLCLDLYLFLFQSCDEENCNFSNVSFLTIEMKVILFRISDSVTGMIRAMLVANFHAFHVTYLQFLRAVHRQ